MAESNQTEVSVNRILYWKYALFFTISYILSGFFCISQLSVPPDNYSLLWIPSGIGLVMFMILGYSAFFWVVLASFILNSFSYLQHHYQNLSYFKLFFELLNGSIDALQAFLAWKIAIELQRAQKQPLFSNNSQLISFFLFVCLLPSIITSGILILVKTVQRPEGINLAIFLKLSIYLTVGNTIGILLVGPLYWARKLSDGYKKLTRQFPFGIAISIAVILLVSLFEFSSIVFIIIPILILLAKKGNLLHSIIVAFIICLILSIGTAYRLGFFGTHIDEDTSFETALFLLAIMFVLYIATITFSELKLHQENLQSLVSRSVSSLEVSEERYRMLAENIADVIWVWDLSLGKFTYISPSVFQLRGLTAEEAMMETIDSSLEPDSARKVMDKLAFEIKNLKNYKDEKKYFYDELQQYKKDGTLIWIETVTHLVFNSKGQMEIVGVSRDIQKRKIAEEIQIENQNKLKELNATKDKFFSIIAHDLMNPFHTLIGFSTLLIGQTARKDLDGVLVSAKLMQNSAEKTRNLLKNLLEWSYTQTDKISFEPENLEALDILKEVIGLLKAMADQKGIEINFDVPDNGLVYADKQMIHTILRNLISNAIKYTYSGGRINITVAKNNTDWIFSVKDNGLGMASEISQNIFKIGAHQSELGTEKEQGTGLGLILCKEFVDHHQGKIWVESNIREGSTFSFSIPLV